jgi:uncharacterized protein (DUF169 family)
MTRDWKALSETLTSAFGDLTPVAVAYLDALPAGVERFEGTVPSGCTFWKLAAEGRAFYTVPQDHFNCAVGSHTHHIDLPESRAAELGQTLDLMASVGYLRMEEVPGMPRLEREPTAIYYAPLAATAIDPDVVIFTGTPGRLMQLQEAAGRAGAMSTLPLLGRPTCMALPAAIDRGAVMSTGCIGNRIYTARGDDELYLMVPGARLPDVAAEAAAIVGANKALDEYHRERRATLTRPRSA